MNKKAQDIAFRFRAVSRGASIIIGLAGVMVLFGWAFDIPALKSVSPDFVSMKANTALCFLLIGVSLLLLQTKESGVSLKARRIAYLCAFIVTCIGLLSFSEYLFHCDLGIDQMLFKEPPGTVGTYYPGRMAPNTALSFFLIGISLLLLDVRTKRGYCPSHWLILGVGLISLLALIGYIYGVKSFYGRFLFTTAMAVHTAALFSMVCIGILFARTDLGIMALVASEGFGGLMLRRLFPPMLIISLVTGWLRDKAYRAGLFESSLATAIRTLLDIILFTILIWISTRLLQRLYIQKEEADKALLDSEKKYRNLFQGIPNGFAFCRIITEKEDKPVDFIYLDVNNSFERLTGLNKEDVVGKRATQVIPGIKDAHPELFDIYGKVALQGEEAKFDIYFKPLGVWLSILAYSPRKGYFVAVFDNITEQKKAQDELRAAYEKLKGAQEQLIQSAKMSAIGQLASGVAHEINNPLSVISGETQMSLKDIDRKGKGIKDVLKIILAQSKRIEEIVSRLSEFSRKSDFKLERVDLNGVINESISLLSYQAKREDIKIIKELASNIPEILCDKHQIQEVFLNIMLNAVQSMAHVGTLAIKTYSHTVSEIEAMRTGKFRVGEKVAVIEIKDTGKGMDEETQKEIFNPFFTTREDGVGLGLPISYGIVENHGGVIEVESKMGEGSAFLVKLPIPER